MLLIEAGADAGATDEDGNNTLHIATRFLHYHLPPHCHIATRYLHNHSPPHCHISILPQGTSKTNNLPTGKADLKKKLYCSGLAVEEWWKLSFFENLPIATFSTGDNQNIFWDVTTKSPRGDKKRNLDTLSILQGQLHRGNAMLFGHGQLQASP